ncbi:uncharacterized protein C8Q71DRAFT_853477 [Rhodofomes roseus]|uniref:Uncharacterized protein n=1 Tax=Rhodofomes roseus TaxID=34475 RepID=A0ABQ8KXD6_9APHY|nr:uncharacterized protein C8Q71DRAFT_853477 [Rhodofomes roseus]KAH9842965.1 hypothetical protein C8Q71DRAFT_853477 [Rhodofomes roseus]
MADTPASERRTRATNAFKRPGLPDLENKVKRRTKEEMAQAKQAEDTAQKAAAQARARTIQNVATVQHDMQQRDAEEQAQRILPPKYAVKRSTRSDSNTGKDTAGINASPGQGGLGVNAIPGDDSAAMNDKISDSESADTPLQAQKAPSKKKKRAKKVTRSDIDNFPLAETQVPTSVGVTPAVAARAGKPKDVNEPQAGASGKRKLAPSTGTLPMALASPIEPSAKRLKPAHPSGMLVSWKGLQGKLPVTPPSLPPQPATATRSVPAPADSHGPEKSTRPRRRQAPITDPNDGPTDKEPAPQHPVHGEAIGESGTEGFESSNNSIDSGVDEEPRRTAQASGLNWSFFIDLLCILSGHRWS